MLFSLHVQRVTMKVLLGAVLAILLLTSLQAAATPSSRSKGRRVFGQGPSSSNARKSTTTRIQRFPGGEQSRSWRRTTHMTSRSSCRPIDDMMWQAQSAELMSTHQKQAVLPEPSLPEYSWDPSVDNGDVMTSAQHGETNAKFQDAKVDLAGQAEQIWNRHSSRGTPGHDASDSAGTGSETNGSPKEAASHSPVIYRYFGRSRSRLHSADSIPFIVIGPCVEHWKTIGEALASRGFNVMACELVDDEHGGRRYGQQGKPDEGKNLILAVLDALRWNRAILVGCDSEASMAIQAAIQLAPDRVAGLVLCGDLSAVEQMAKKAIAAEMDMRMTKNQKNGALDTYLWRHLHCPYTVVWNGDEAHRPSTRVEATLEPAATGDMFAFNRCLILGGGSAPHRRLPEQFSWALTRFVEEKIVPLISPLPILSREAVTPHASRERRRRCFFRHNQLFTPGNALVLGRAAATVLFYATSMKIAMYQYGNVKGGVSSIQHVIRWLTSGQRKLFQGATGFLTNYGYVFHFLVARATNNPDYLEEHAESLDDTTACEEDEPQKDGGDAPQKDNHESRRLYLLDSVIV